jgi:putative transposase
MVEAIKLSREKNPFDLWAWVIMPEHVHLVLLPSKNVKIASIMTTMKQSISRRAINWLKKHSPRYLEQLLDAQPNGKQSHRFWQRGGGYDRNLRSTRDVHEKILYIHENPVKRGLSTTPDSWSWSSAKSWATGNDQPISIDRKSVPNLTIVDDQIDSKLWR